MTEPAPATVTCPQCGNTVAGGRFCNACGSPLDLHATTRGLLADSVGVKRVNFGNYGRTAWMAVSEPATLTGRWMRGERVGLVSPIAMMGAVTLVTAIVGYFLTRWTGTRQAASVIDLKTMLDIAPFLRGYFPQAQAAAALDTKALNDQFQQVVGWFSAFYPTLLILPGWLGLAPWRRIDRREALIFAIVESVFLLILTGINVSLRLVAPDAMDTAFAGLIFTFAVFYHCAEHLRGLINCSWGYCLTRPLIATVLVMVLMYAWLVVLMMITLAIWR